MRFAAWLRAHPRTLAGAGVVTAGAVAITTLAFVYQGNPTTEVDLNDGSVWVTKQSSFMVGHFNHESEVLDGGLRTATDDYDILQSAQNVLLHDLAGNSLSSVDPSTVALTGSTPLPAGAQVTLGANTVAVLDPAKGSLWVVPAAGVGGFTAAATKPVATLGAGAAATVGVDGTVYAVSPAQGTLWTVPVDAEGAALKAEKKGFDGLAKNAQVTITAVGTTPVVLDPGTGTVRSPSGLNATVPAPDGAVLQQPSAADADVTVATSTALVRMPLGGGSPQANPAQGTGTPAAPVRLNGCTYGAWSGSGRFVRDCTGTADDLAADIPGIDTSANLTFRQNRDVVVLNDIIGGMAWMASDSLQQVDNWDELTPPEGDAEENEQEVTEETVQSTLPERSATNTPPVANPDEFGVRPGRTTVLPVLDNDTDADGDVLTVSVPDGDPSLGQLQSIDNGSGLQIIVPEDASGTARFTYKVDDGRRGVDTATVTLTVHPLQSDQAPRQVRVTSLTMEAGGVLTYNVLSDWRDPDGDSVYLVSADAAKGDEVETTTDGRVTYRAVSGTLGRKDVKIRVSDGTKVTEGTLHLDVRPRGATEPVATADHVVTRVGQSVTVSPLTNDYSAGSQELRLTRVDDVDGADITPDFAGKTFAFTSDNVGTYYVQYLVAAGTATADGIVRVDVLADTGTDDPPVAVQDIALLPDGGDTLVNVLANDSDPAGGILVVQSVSVPESSGISVAVLGHETLRVTDQGSLAEQVTIDYTISNGARSADGQVVVIPVPAPEVVRPPVADDDEAVVRAGDVVTIPVLDNDSDPNGGTLHVADDLVEPLPDAATGTAFVSQDTVRFKAGSEPGTVGLTYEVVNASGQKDAGYVSIQVLAVDAANNQAPRPKDVTARVLGGAKVRVSIPLDGIDPDGDSVTLEGIASAPAKGRVVEVGADYIDYEAIGGGTGADSFTYRVRDRLGRDATATVRVGIAPAASDNQAPYAVKDAVAMRPGREVAVPVLTNDSDPEGDAIGLVSNGIILPDEPGLAAKVSGDRIIVDSPDHPVDTSLQYTIRDADGAEAVGVLQVSVADDVPLLRPVARDDRVAAADVDDGAVRVDVLANDEDPDGVTADLKVTVADDAAQVDADGAVRVTLGEKQQILTYTVTDRDGLTASAFIRVPALAALSPALTSTGAVTVRSGQTVTIPLADHVRVWRGSGAVITEADKVAAVHGNGAELVKDQHTLVYTPADGYSGPDALTFEVTDGTGPDDPEGQKATLVLPITVLPAENQAPTFRNGALSVAQGDDGAGLDLRALTTDPDEGDLAGMTYRITGGVPDGLSAAIDGQKLTARADASAPKGTAATIGLTIDDGHGHSTTGTVTVTVTASTRPLPTANDDTVPDAAQGKTVRVDVLDNDFNPFPDHPLTVTSAVTESGVGAVSVAGDHLQITPDGSFVGRMVVRYRVQDETADPDREVEGHVILTVQGVPAAPGTPTVSSVQDRTVVLSWMPPVDNGSAITKYTVSAVGGGYSRTCASTTCTLSGLTNNVEYTFHVVAVNGVGPSPASPASEPARPDARPDTPAAPTLTYGDKSLKVAWKTPSTPGSPVQSYNLEISPAPPSGIATKTKVTGTSTTWSGLENGVAYQVRVQAVNRAPEPSSWSTWSATEVPATVPAAPAAPTSTMVDPVAPQSQMKVLWKAPADNGDKISGYQLVVMRGASTVQTLEPSSTSQTISVANSTTDYTFKVRAHNKAGWGAWSKVSAARRSVAAPGAPGTPKVTAGDKKLTVSFTAATGNGATSGEIRYQYSLNGGAWTGSWTSAKGTITGLANGTAYTVRVRGVSTVDGATYPGAASGGASATPYGPPRTPSATAKASGQKITFGWTVPAANGLTVHVRYRIDGGSWTNATKTGSKTVTYGYSKTGTIEVQSVDSKGQTSSTVTKKATTAAKPAATATVSKGSSAAGESGCKSGKCYHYKVTTKNFTAGTYTVSCNATSTTDNPFSTYTNVKVPADGSFEPGCYFGYSGEQVWVTIGGKDYGKTTWKQ
ncbi:tandem-95 repeat protein [Microbacterium protaetiae]|uniref:Tandem-95 repeat protein n=1 Tax=Microbacterium protaetiae TaxID=2509458 RepID=A0A4P6ECH2_9MICO|nr:Ig-like domain-containing protein [Microbacterium protaetiae]QAY59932.1 tandem-95 repeat protein [Microbacterium protaetiae]